MGIKFGDIDANQILENEFRIGVLEGILDWILRNNSAFVSPLSEETVDNIRKDVIIRLMSKYPNSGIELRKGEQNVTK